MRGKVRVLGCVGGEAGGREEKEHTDRYVPCSERKENEGHSRRKGENKDDVKEVKREVTYSNVYS